MQQVGTIRSNGRASFCYGKAQAVAAGSKTVIAEFAAPDAGSAYGISLGLGIDNVTGWGAGAAFAVYIGGREMVTFSDQISDLLRPEFLPMEIKGGETVRIDFINATAFILSASVFARIESY